MKSSLEDETSETGLTIGLFLVRGLTIILAIFSTHRKQPGHRPDHAECGASQMAVELRGWIFVAGGIYLAMKVRRAR